jgi:hypothetical protein
MANDGISRLIAVTQMKTTNANDEALRRADQQRRLVGQHRNLQAVKRSFDELPKVEQQSALLELQTRLPGFRSSLSPSAAALLDQWLQWASEHR